MKGEAVLLSRGMLFVAATVSFFPGGALCHGGKCTLLEGSTAVQAAYHDGSPMAFCDVFAAGPGDSLPYRAGSTDSLGIFAFVPGRPGLWKIRVDDGMGHLAQAEVEISPSGKAVRTGAETPGVAGGTAIGLGVIFGLFGVFAMMRSRRRGDSSVVRRIGDG